MKFTRMGQWHEISQCGKYVVSGAHVVDRFKFQGWLLAPEKGKTAQLLGTFDTADEARTCCDELQRDGETLKKRVRVGNTQTEA